MAQSVVYADLKFAAVPPLTAPACPTAPEEDDSPYENVPLGSVPVAPSPGRWPRRWRIPVGLLAASLLLLLVVATVALGACYWQVTRSLQDTSREHAAEQGRLSQEVSARERSLEQARLELAWARAELQRAWREGNSSRLEVGSLSGRLADVTEVLGKTEKEMQEVQEELRASQSTVSSLRACVNTDCCPSGWVLYRSKCLFISVEKKTWQESETDCRRRSARLLVQGNWPSWTVPHFVQASGVKYWIGDGYKNRHNKPEGLYEKQHYMNGWFSCATISTDIGTFSCFFSLPWICEKTPNMTSPSKTFFPLLAKG